MLNKLSVVCILLVASVHLSAAVIPDSSVETQVTGQTDFMITHGRQEGINLFHSFNQFSIADHESATFIKDGIRAPNDIRNILARVTGINKSEIFGSLNSDFDADLYLMNPNGIIFGEKAKLNVLGSFHATTAYYLRFIKEDGKNAFFSANLSDGSSFISAAPAAFGFLDNNIGEITIKGEEVLIEAEEVRLEVPKKATLSFIGGDINIKDRILYAPSGRINLAAVASGGEVKLTPNDLVIDPDQKTGKINITRSSAKNKLTVFQKGKRRIPIGENEDGEPIYASYANIDVSNYHGTTNAGQIFIRGGQFLAEKARIFADVYELADVYENGKESQETTNASINIAMDGYINFQNRTVIATNSDTETESGDITITAENLTFQQTKEFDDESGDYLNDYLGLISTDSFGPGTAGDINIELTGSLDLSPGGILSSARSYGRGNGGNIHIEAKEVILQNDGMIAVETFGDNAGNITIIATDNIEIANYGIISAAANISSIGDAGNIDLITSELILTERGVINNRSAGKGNAGSITITANIASLIGMSDITTEAKFAGGGNIKFKVRDRFELFDDSRITAEAFGKNPQDNGGNIIIESPDLFTLNNSQLLARAYAGNGGNIDITTNNFKMSVDSLIDTSSALGLNGKFILNDITLNFLTSPPEELPNYDLSLNRCTLSTEDLVSSFYIITRDTLPTSPTDLRTNLYFSP